MKKKIIGVVVIIVMAIVANYPMYRDLKESVKAAQDVITTVNETIADVQTEVDSWKEEVDSLTTRINKLQDEFYSAIEDGLAQADSTLKEIKALKIETSVLTNKIQSVKSETMAHVEAKIMDYVLETKIENNVNKKAKKKVKQIIPGLPGF